MCVRVRVRVRVCVHACVCVCVIVCVISLPSMFCVRLGRRGLHGFLLTLSGVFCLAWSLADWSGKMCVFVVIVVL